MPNGSSPSTIANVGGFASSEPSLLEDFPELNITNRDDEVRETENGRTYLTEIWPFVAEALKRRFILQSVEKSGIRVKIRREFQKTAKSLTEREVDNKERDPR